MNTTTNTRGVSEAMVERIEGIMREDCPGSTETQIKETALRIAALSAPEPAAQGEADGWPVLAEELSKTFSAEIYDLFADADEITQSSVVNALERAIKKHCKFPVADFDDYDLEGVLLTIEQRQKVVKEAMAFIDGKPAAWRCRYFDKETGVGFWRYSVGEPQRSHQTGNMGFEKEALYTAPPAQPSERVPEITREMWEAGRDAYAMWITEVYQKRSPEGPTEEDRQEGYERAKAAMLTASPAPSERVPEGMVLVPREPTAAMADAFGSMATRGFHDCYADMLTATPAAPAEEGKGVDRG